MIVTFKTIPDWRLNIDRYNHTVERLNTVKKGDNKGKMSWVPASYHSNISQACHSLALELIGEDQQIKEINDVRDLMVDIFAKISTITLPITEE
jgi:hypothetical protein